MENILQSNWDVLHVLVYSCDNKRLIHLKHLVGSSQTFLERIFKSMSILLATVNFSYDCEMLYFSLKCYFYINVERLFYESL